MTYTLYWSPDSANLIVRTALEEMELSYEDVLVDRGRAAQRSPEYMRLNPQGLLPVLLAPEQEAPRFETGAILLYLADRHGALLPGGARGRGEALKWLFYLSNTVHADLRILFYAHRYVEDAALAPAVRAAVRQRLRAHLALLDAEIARHGGPWLLAAGYSVCDIYLGYCARWAQLYPAGEALDPQELSRCSALWGMLSALEQRAAVQRACAREEVGPYPFTAPVVPRPTHGSVTG